jgi:uncharacterized cupredoxin-like copper-binding protein
LSEIIGTSELISDKEGQFSMTIAFRIQSPLARVALGAALLLFGIQATHAHSDHDMDHMDGAQHGASFEHFSFGEPGNAGKVDRTVKITMKDLSFEPAFLKVKVGETVRFIVTNASDVDHDFTLGDVPTQVAHRQEMVEMAEKGGEMHHEDDPNAILVKSRQTAKLIWKFTKTGKFEFDCNVPGHFEGGMTGVITVVSRSKASAAPHSMDMSNMPAGEHKTGN